MHTLSTSFILGYHGCTKQVADSLLSGEAFAPSQNDYDWLGHGIYFWEANPGRAFTFAQESIKRKRQSAEPAVVGAVLNMGLCLDTTTQKGLEALKMAYSAIAGIVSQFGEDLPTNSRYLKKLDCLVFNTLHDMRASEEEPPIDTVRGIFIEGKELYLGSTLHEKTHIQVCVCNPDSIKGVFRVDISQF